MPVDPTISLGLKPYDPASAPNPLAMLGQFAGVQNQMNQNRLFQQTFAARNEAGQIIAGAPDMDTAIQRMLANPRVAPFAGETINAFRTAQQTLTDIQGKQQEQAQSGLQAVIKSLPGALADPNQFDSLVSAQLGTLSPQAKARVAPAIDSIRTALLNNLSQDSVQARQQFSQRLGGILLGTDIGPAAIHGIMGTPTMLDLGGAKQPVVQAPAQGFAGGPGGGLTPGGAPLSLSLAPTVTTGPYGPGGAQQPTIIGGGGAGVGPANGWPAVGGRIPPTSGWTAATGVTNDQYNDNGMALAGTPRQPVAAAPLGPLPMPTVSPTAAPGPVGPTQTQSTYNESRGKDMADYQKSLDERTSVGGQILKTLGEARGALSNFEPGGGASTYARIGQLAQAFGASGPLVDRIANGDLSASQEFNKLMVNTTMGQIREQLTGIGASRLSQMEFKSFNENNPNIDTDPRAIEKIFNFWTRLYQQDHAEQTGLQAHLKAGGDISAWPSIWQDQAQKKGYINPRITYNAIAPGAGTVTHQWIPGRGLQPAAGP